jgi:HK97 family phage major capsid protein
MSDKPGRRSIEILLTIPWAIRPEWAKQMLTIARRDGLTPEAVAAELGQPLNNTRTVTVREGIATIPMSGPMFRYANIFADVSGATSYEALATDLRVALDDRSVLAILLAVDSPGGEVFGASELSDMVFNARGTKPIVAHVSGFGASAAYWIASAADDVVTSSTGILGSLGVCMSVTVPGDEPDLFGDREIEFVSSQSPDKHLDPTSKAGREQHQAIVDKLAGVFLADAARNRGMAEATVLNGFGKGGTFVGADAVTAGLADRVATFEATHAALVARTSRGGVLPFRTAAVEPANTATLLAQILEAVGLEHGIRYAARARLTATSSIPAPVAAPLPPAPKAEPKEDPVMSDHKTVAPDAGADQLANFKERLASISNLCAAAGFPEKAVEYTDGELSIDAIGVELLGLKKANNKPDTLDVPNADTGIRVGKDREAEKPFAHIGEQLAAIAASYAPPGVSVGGFRGGQVDKRLPHISAAVSGASTAVGGDGGWLIQKDFTVDLMKNAFESGALASRCSQTEIGANSDGLEVVTINETSRATGSRWGGVRVYRVAEADTAAKSKPKIGKWESRLEDLMGVAYMTERLMRDAPAMGSVFSEAFTDEFAFVVDDEIFRGTGAGQMMGVLNAPATVSVAKETGPAQTAATIVAENIMNMWARVLPRSKASPAGAWFVNTETSPQLQQMQIGTGVSGTLVYMAPGGLSGSPYGSIYGKPVVEIEHASALGTVGDISYLDLARYKLITKGGIEAADSIHVRFLYNERTFRWVSRINGAPKENSPITPYKGTSGKTLSSFVTLATRA